MRVATFDISRISTAVRRREAILRYAQYLLIFDFALFLWGAISGIESAASLRGLTRLNWEWDAQTIGPVAVTYLLLAHRLRWPYAAIFVAQAGYYLMTDSLDNKIIGVSVQLTSYVATTPAMRPLVPLATELAAMNIAFSYIMIVWCVYSVAWIMNAGYVPSKAYGRRLSALEPLYPSRLFDTLLPGHRSQKVTPGEAVLFTFSSVLFVAASMAPFGGLRIAQNAFLTVAPRIVACAEPALSAQDAQAVLTCWAGFYPWSHAAIDLGVPIAVAVVCLVLANRLRHFGRQHFIGRLSKLPLSTVGATLFLRAFRDDQVSIRRANRNLFSLVFDLGRVPSTLDELMLERLDGRGDLIAIGNPQDHRGAAWRSPWGAQRLYADDAHWKEIATTLMDDAARIILCVDGTDGVRWEIAQALQGGHANKTLFFFNPSTDIQMRARLLTEDFLVPPEDFELVDIASILALRLTAAQTIQIFCARPERQAYLVAARLAFEEVGYGLMPACLAHRRTDAVAVKTRVSQIFVGAAMAKEKKTATELAGLIAEKIAFVKVHADPAPGWHATVVSAPSILIR